MADKPVGEVVAVDAVLDALSSPTSSDVYEALQPFSNDAVGAVAAKRALAGGGGNGGSQPVTISETDPGAIGAGGLWLRLDPSESYPPMLYVRDAEDNGWADLDNAGYLLGLTYYDSEGVAVTTFAGNADEALIRTTGSSLDLFSNGVATLAADTSVTVQVGDDITLNNTGHDKISVTNTETVIYRNDVRTVEIDDESVKFTTSKIGFFTAAPVIRPLVPITTPDVQDVIDALVALGLVVQSD